MMSFEGGVSVIVESPRRRDIRKLLECTIHGLIDALDAIDAASEDAEDSDSDEDTIEEPSLGATHEMDQERTWAPSSIPFSVDCELDETDTTSPLLNELALG